jgi:excisionase family DNA binding protein
MANVTVKEAARLLAMSELTVRKLAWNGKIASTHIGRAVRIPASEIDRILKEGTVIR